MPAAPPRARQNQAHAWPGAGDLWRAGPSTRGATAPQGAQQVNFVVGCDLRQMDLVIFGMEAENEKSNIDHEAASEEKTI